MKIITKTSELEEYVRPLKAAGKSLGFTPTMGALHKGHFTLIAKSIAENDVSICSIFVNPTQFNVAEDLEKYPRTLEKDAQGLEENGCDILYAPSVDEIYPDGDDYEVEVDLNGLDKVLEGAHRPGHFEGVVQVVKRLLEVTSCDRLYMGQKDFQQFTIIRQMIVNLDMPVELRVCPISRDDDGLAKSSRNVRLTAEHRRRASIIYRVLKQSKVWIEEHRSSVEICTKALEYLSVPGFKPEYFDLIDGYTLQNISKPEEHEVIVACTAVWAGEVRLIDNMILKGAL